MSMNTFKKSKRFCGESGIALITTLLLLFLMSSLLVGFTVLVMSNQQLASSNNDDVTAFYGAEAGMEQMTAGLGDLFAKTYSPSASQIQTVGANPPLLQIAPGKYMQYVYADGSDGYTITPSATDVLGNPAPVISTIKSGTYAGMTAMLTEYKLLVNGRTPAGREVKLLRTVQTVGIPMFQFGMFSDSDLDFFPGPDFNFGGRTHTNGNLFLATGATLSLSDKVDVYKDVIRTNLENGWPTSSNYTGTVQITTQPPGGNPCTNCRALATNEGSLTGTIGSSADTNWPIISTGNAPADYNGNLINGQGSAFPQYSTGAKKLDMGIVMLGTNGSTQPIDLLRRPVSGEDPNITGERYFAQASLKVLLSDDTSDIMNLPCIDAGTQPFDLSSLAMQPKNPATGVVNWTGSALTLYNMMIANGVQPLPLAASGARTGGYLGNDGYWTPAMSPKTVPNLPWPIIKGYIKIEEQIAYGSPCGTWKDVTLEVLSYGYVGRNINPVPQSLDNLTLNPQWQYWSSGLVPLDMKNGNAPYLPIPPTAALGFQNTSTTLGAGTFTAASVSTVNTPKSCPEIHPWAVIRLERIRDNPSSVNFNTLVFKASNPSQRLPFQSTVAEVCGVDPANVGKLPLTRSGVSTGGVWGTASTWVPQVYDFWPNTLFDTREGTLRDSPMSAANLPTLNGTMHYIEIDGANLASWFGGKIGTMVTSGQGTKDPAVAPNNFVVYVSDRRGNYSKSQSLTGGWPPLSYTKNETGEFGWNDIVNFPVNSTTGCPSNSLEQGEDADKTNVLYTYGANQSYLHAAGVPDTVGNPLAKSQIGIFAGLAGTGVIANSVCPTVPGYVTDNIWPMMVAANTNAARENPALFFRRAVKLTDSSLLTAVGPCPGGTTCGLTIASENPVYIQGDYNANSGGNNWSDPSIATSVAADAVTLLSDNWNDVNSFTTPYAETNRNAVTTFYRTAVIAGSTPYFSNPSGIVGQDFGTDGGVHNFLRYIENWSGDTLNYKGSIINMFYSRQANGLFKCCNQVYSPPDRGYNFDTNFLTPALLPPRTPLLRDINTTGWTRVLLTNQP
ncbi:MAG: PilX N-terminal domain-containing pilus assembly protein [Candidatus Acidiferrum sp.]